jgi:hypothetical protein
MTSFRYLGKMAFMASKIKQALKQLRKALHEQREYELLLRAESTHRYDTLVGKLIPLIPFFVSKFDSSANEETSPRAAQADPHTTEAETAAGPPNYPVHWFYHRLRSEHQRPSRRGTDMFAS